MSQVNNLKQLAASYLGIEQTFGTVASTLYRAYPVGGSVAIELSQTEAENENQSIYLHDYKSPVRGLMGGSVKMNFYLRPHATAFSGSNTRSDHYLQQIMKAGFGGHQANSGSFVGASATTTSLPVNDTSRLAVGQYAIFSSSVGREVAMVIDITTGSISVTPALSAAPVSGSMVVNMDNFYPTETNTNSLTFQHAQAQDSTLQWQMTGCKVNALNLKLERDAIMTVEAELDVKSWSTGSLGLSTAVGTDVLESPMVMKGATILLQPTTTTTRTHYPLESVSVKTNLGNEYLEELGGVEGATGVMRTGQRMFSEVTAKFRVDTARDVQWADQTALQLHCFVPYTNSSGQLREVVVGMPTCIMVGKPKMMDEGGRLVMEVTLRGKLNTLCSSQTTELGRSPLTLAVG
jgi:hypothetical protein